MTTKDFLRLGHTRWVECHWSIAATLEQAQAWFAQRNLTGNIISVGPNWWMPL